MPSSSPPHFFPLLLSRAYIFISRNWRFLSVPLALQNTPSFHSFPNQTILFLDSNKLSGLLLLTQRFSSPLHCSFHLITLVSYSFKLVFSNLSLYTFCTFSNLMISHQSQYLCIGSFVFRCLLLLWYIMDSYGFYESRFAFIKHNLFAKQQLSKQEERRFLSVSVSQSGM